jgi:ppGpp synthetase/RelA/SpoT-type nucleotidyltranferase|tara:strand:+ start:512 stop:901 length:390 start_codon:yes stop_codon:yes gene_type:complete
MKISDRTAISMPMRNLIGIIAAVSVGVWAFFGIQETLNKHSTTLELMSKDLEANSEFRIKYPRGELGQSSGEAELFMLVEHMSSLLEDLNKEIKDMRNNKVNIDFLKERVKKLGDDVEKLIRNGNGIKQ